MRRHPSRRLPLPADRSLRRTGKWQRYCAARRRLSIWQGPARDDDFWDLPVCREFPLRNQEIMRRRIGRPIVLLSYLYSRSKSLPRRGTTRQRFQARLRVRSTGNSAGRRAGIEDAEPVTRKRASASKLRWGNASPIAAWCNAIISHHFQHAGGALSNMRRSCNGATILFAKIL